MAALFVANTRAKRTPWLAWTEWQFTFEQLFSTDNFNKQVACDRITAWISRGHVPVAVRCTAQLVEFQLLDQSSNTDTHAVRVSTTALRSLAGMAITKLVNGLVDPLQRHATARSIGALARSIQLPSTLVDLRHEITHAAEPPTLNVLRNGIAVALEWLHHHYWHAQLQHLTACQNALIDLMTQYQQTQRQQSDDSNETRTLSLKIAATCQNDSSMLHSIVLPMLLGRTTAISAASESMLLVTPKAGARVSTSHDNVAKIALKHRQQWLPLFRALSQALPSTPIRLLFALIDCVSDESQQLNNDESELNLQSEWRLALSISWIRFLLEELMQTLNQSTTNGNLFSSWASVADPQSELYENHATLSDRFYSIVKLILQSPNIWSLCLVAPLMNCLTALLESSISSEMKKKLTDMQELAASAVSCFGSAALLTALAHNQTMQVSSNKVARREFAHNDDVVSLHVDSVPNESKVVRQARQSCLFGWLSELYRGDESTEQQTLQMDVAALQSKLQQRTKANAVQSMTSFSETSVESVAPWTLMNASEWSACAFGTLPRALQPPPRTVVELDSKQVENADVATTGMTPSMERSHQPTHQPRTVEHESDHDMEERVAASRVVLPIPQIELF